MPAEHQEAFSRSKRSADSEAVKAEIESLLYLDFSIWYHHSSKFEGDEEAGILDIYTYYSHIWNEVTTNYCDSTCEEQPANMLIILFITPIMHFTCISHRESLFANF